MELGKIGKSVSMRYLIEHGMYYNVQPEALIFLPTSEHRKEFELERKKQGCPHTATCRNYYADMCDICFGENMLDEEKQIC